MRSIIDDDNQKTYIKCYSCRVRRLFFLMLTLQLKHEIRGICVSDEFARRAAAAADLGISSIVQSTNLTAVLSLLTRLVAEQITHHLSLIRLQVTFLR
jgi:hypothetical protein